MSRIVDTLVRGLFAPLLQAKASPNGWHVIGWDAEQGLSLTLGLARVSAVALATHTLSEQLVLGGGALRARSRAPGARRRSM
ncbi:MAG: hypothetical protein IT372_15950 [Polyangiaceae bacterium]|nr:hypothetical protein [Polyangiaceae bacterium]